MILSRRLIVGFVLVALGLAGCGQPLETTELVASTEVPTEQASATSTQLQGSGCNMNTAAYTSNSSDGNHFVPAQTDLRQARRVEINLGAELAWIVGLGTEAGSRWFVSDVNGRISDVVVEGEPPAALSISEPWPEQAPLAISRVEAGVELMGERLLPFSPLTHPVQLTTNELAVVTTEGGLTLVRDGVSAELPIAPLPDARLLADEAGDLLLYSNPTGSYDHGVLGDRLEAGAVTMVDTAETAIGWSYEAPGRSVFEGLAPLWVDFNQDGNREVIATASDPAQGARYLVIGQGGELVAESDPIGRGYRWRHAIAAAPVAPDGSWELVGVRTPHLGGIVEFYQWEGDVLTLTAELAGYSSHRLGSRNLDQGLVADFDGDGQYELMVPTQDYSSLAVIGRTDDGAVEELALDLPSNLSTNLAVACHQGQALGLAAGLADGSLVFWLP